MDLHNETTYSIADEFSLTSPTISRYMTGQMPAKITTIKLMAKYFKVNPVWLMGYDVPMEIELTPDEAWDIEAKQFEDKLNAFHYQLRSLGWICEWSDEDNVYTLSKGNASFKITNVEYSSLIEDMLKFSEKRLLELYNDFDSRLFSSNTENKYELRADQSQPNSNKK